MKSNPFHNCPKLKEITISKDNPYFTSEDGILFNKEKTTLYSYPSGKEGYEYTIPSSVNTIEDAFSDSVNLIDIIIPHFIKDISNAAFYIDSKCTVWATRENVDKIRKDLDSYYSHRHIEVGIYKVGIIKTKNIYYKGYEFDIIPFKEPVDYNVTLFDGNGNIQKLEMDKNGHYNNLNLIPDNLYRGEISYVYNGEPQIYSWEIQTSKPNPKLSQINWGHTKIKMSFECELDKTVKKWDEFGTEDTPWDSNWHEFTNLEPSKSYTFKPYVVIDSKKYYGTDSRGETEGIHFRMKSDVTPTTIVMQGGIEYQNYGSVTIIERGYETQNNNIKNQIKLNEKIQTFTGLKPNTEYVIEYYIVTKENNGKKYSNKYKLKTKDLELTTLQPKSVSSTCAIVAAKTNLSDLETNVGFQWKKYDAPESLKPSEGNAAIYDGQMEGYIKNLQPTSYYKVRAFYKTTEDKYYYGDWVTFDPSDFSYFEPTVHTYPAFEVTHNSVALKGYVMAGTDAITEQGFQYWKTGSSTKKAKYVRSNAPYDEINTIFSSGQVMSTVIEGLEPSTSYTCRAFVKTASNTIYGEEQTFTTAAPTSGIYDIITDETANPTVVGYYTINGQRFDAPQKGLNIVKYSDGSVKKMIIR